MNSTLTRSFLSRKVSKMFKKPVINTDIILLSAFYCSMVALTLPISHNKPAPKIREFKISKWRFTCVLCALISEVAFIYTSYVHLKNCGVTFDCSQSYVTLIEACYALNLLIVALFSIPNSLCHLLSTISSNLTSSHRVTRSYLFKITLKCSLLYIFIIIELFRKTTLESFGTPFLTAFLYYTKFLIHSFDNLLLTFLFLLEIQFHVLNHRLALITSRFSQIQPLISNHWHTTTILKQVSKCLGQLFLITLVYKQLQVAGMIYFNLLSNLPDDGDDLIQILDLSLPMFILAFICIETSEVLSQCHNFILTLHGHITQNDKITSGTRHRDMILSYPKLLHSRSVQITACNCIIIRAGLILKIGAVASTSIIAVVQLNPLPENMTITE